MITLNIQMKKQIINTSPYRNKEFHFHSTTFQIFSTNMSRPKIIFQQNA